MAEGGWKSEIRPCIVNGESAIWHRWVEIREYIGPGLTMLNDHPGGFVCDTLALVELENGEVKKVPVSCVRFLGSGSIFERINSIRGRAEREEPA